MHRRIGVVLLTASLVLAACGDRPDDDQGLDADYGDDPTTETTGPNGADPDNPTTTAKNSIGADGKTTTTGRSTNTTARGSTQTTTAANSDAAIQQAARGGVGAFARTILRPQPATQVVLEVFQMSGAAPRQNTIDHVLSTLRQVTGKTVNLSGPITVPSRSGAISQADIQAMADTHGKAEQGGGQAVIHLLFIHGEFEGDDSVLGIAVRGDTAAIMSDQVNSAGTPIASASRIEDAVTMHEAGHLLGLVDIARNTGRADPDHPGHSKNRDSVMFWAVESDIVSQVLGGPPPVNFDSADLADLAALRNGA